MVLKSTDQTLEKAARGIKKLLRKHTDINEVQFGFITGYGATGIIFILKQPEEK